MVNVGKIYHSWMVWVIMVCETIYPQCFWIFKEHSRYLFSLSSELEMLVQLKDLPQLSRYLFCTKNPLKQQKKDSSKKCLGGVIPTESLSKTSSPKQTNHRAIKKKLCYMPLHWLIHRNPCHHIVYNPSQLCIYIYITLLCICANYYNPKT